MVENFTKQSQTERKKSENGDKSSRTKTSACFLIGSHPETKAAKLEYFNVSVQLHL